jgi:hypothetical protein
VRIFLWSFTWKYIILKSIQPSFITLSHRFPPLCVVQQFYMNFIVSCFYTSTDVMYFIILHFQSFFFSSLNLL